LLIYGLARVFISLFYYPRYDSCLIVAILLIACRGFDEEDGRVMEGAGFRR